MRISGTDGFSDYILNAHGLEYGAHGATGNDARPRRRRPENHASGTITALNVMMQGPTLPQGNLDHLTLGLIGRFANGFGNLPRLTGSKTNTASPVTYDDQSAKREPAATLDHLGDTIDVHQFIEKVVAFFALIIPTSSTAGTTPATARTAPAGSASGAATVLR
jgi:hypothetical protein